VNIADSTAEAVPDIIDVNAYDETSIRVLKGLEGVRMRPAMYIGDTGIRGFHHLLWEIVDNAVDEAMAGHCDHIKVAIKSDGRTATVRDNGRGIPVGIHETEGKSTLEVVLTVLHAGGKFGDSGYKQAGGLHGVGMSCVNALSSDLTATVWRKSGEHGQYTQSYSRGLPTSEVTQLATSIRQTGTEITFYPDNEIFDSTLIFDEDVVVERLKEKAYLHGGLKITFESQRTGRKEVFTYPEGIVDYVRHLAGESESVYPETPVVIKGESSGVQVQVAFVYDGTKDGERTLSYANYVPTIDGGTHLSGFRTAYTRVVNSYARSTGLLKEKDSNLQGNDLRDGMIGVVSVLVVQPQFEGQTKGRLTTPEADGAVQTITFDRLSAFLEKNPSFAKQIIERAILSQKAREAAKLKADAIKSQASFGRTKLPPKLKRCQSNKREEMELFLVEGDSAAGSAKDGRDVHVQEVMPVRGKLINAEKADFAGLLNNQEIQDIIAAIGAGVDVDGQSNFDLASRRHDKVIIMTDADVDGSHIATLMLTFMYRFMRPLIEAGCVYVAQPPFYRVDVGKTSSYCWSEEEMTALSAKAGGKAKIVRFKGLGEMNPLELGRTTMRPGFRRLIRVSADDAEYADKTVTILMGKAVQARKEFIVENCTTTFSEHTD
jgi:DNA gyrase subunit B